MPLNVVFKFLNHAVQKCWVKFWQFNCLEWVKTAVSNGTKRIGLFGTVGILVAVMIIAGLVIGITYLSPANATLTIQIMDAPVALEHLNVTIDSVSIQGQDGGWFNLTLKTEPFYFDLLALQNVSETLSTTAIPAGNYTMIKMHVLTANATFLDGTTADLTVPSDSVKVLLQPQLTLTSGGQVTVLIDLQPEDLDSIAISHSLNLRPVIRAIVPPPA